MNAIVRLLVPVFILTASAVAAQEQPQCGPHEEVAKALTEKYSERVVSAGMTANGSRLVELFVSPTTGTWTLLITDMDGKACMTASGDDWINAAPLPPETQRQNQHLRNLGVQPGGRGA
jgi:hypothetical protein